MARCKMVAVATVLAVLGIFGTGSVDGARDRGIVQPAEKDLSIFDARGKQIGPIISGVFVYYPVDSRNLPLTVSVRVGTKRFGLGVYRDIVLDSVWRFVGNRSGLLLFESADCAGPAYLLVDNDPMSGYTTPVQLWLPGVAVMDNGSVYLGNGPTRPIVARSNLSPPGACNSFPAEPSPYAGEPALLLVDDINAQFTPPFHLE